MPYNIPAINPGHNGSAAFTSDSELIFYIEEERISRNKHDGNPFRAILIILQTFTVDELVIGGTSSELHQLPRIGEDAYTALVRKFNPNVKVTKMAHLRRLGHAASAFYGTDFETATAVVVDGAGILHLEQIGQSNQIAQGYETESIYHCAYPHEFTAVFKRYSNGDGNIVALFQGRSEGGPRALGNRSILFDPRNSEGKNIVNRVKMREWFCPFAGSVLVEDANDWFDMSGLEQSPYMMYAVDVRANRVDQIPAVTHVDNTCRVQTVRKEDTPQYYILIEEFKKLTGIPSLFNTSFNLAGQPLVENLFDALLTLFNGEIKYLYLPDIGKLVTKKHLMKIYYFISGLSQSAPAPLSAIPKQNLRFISGISNPLHT